MKRIIYISSGLVVLISALIVWFMKDASNVQVETKTYYSDWETSYKLNDKNPGGISFFIDLLKTHTRDSVHVLSKWEKVDSILSYKEATYLYIGEQFGMSTKSFDSLSNMAAKGATVILSFKHLTENIYTQIFEPNAYNWDYNKVLFAHLGDSTRAFYHVFQNDTVYGDWYSFQESQIKDSAYHAYMFAMKHPVAFFLNVEKGKVHFHCLPNLFQNIHVSTPNGYAHAVSMFKYIPKHKPIIFLSCADYLKNKPSEYTEEGDFEKEDTSLLQFILKNKPLRIAFLLSIFLLLLYVIFRAKRKENIIPGYPNKHNRSLPYVETLASIYISKKSPIDVLQLVRKNFFFAIQRYYYIDLSNEETRKNAFARLKEKLPESAISLQEIMDDLTTRNKEITDEYVVNLQQKIHTLFINNGIISTNQNFIASNRKLTIHKSISIGLVGIFIGLLVSIRGLALLSGGIGIGILLVVLALLILFLSIRFIAHPYLIIEKNTLIKHGLFFGKKKISLNQHIDSSITEKHFIFIFEDGNNIQLTRLLLATNSTMALKQFVEYLNHKA